MIVTIRLMSAPMVSFPCRFTPMNRQGGFAMSDAHRRYRAIKDALLQCFAAPPTGHQEKHLHTLVALICGLVGGRHAHLATIADHAPCGTATQESLIKRFR